MHAWWHFHDVGVLFQAILTKGTIQIQITENFENTDKSKHLQGQFGLPVVSKSVTLFDSELPKAYAKGPIAFI